MCVINQSKSKESAFILIICKWDFCGVFRDCTTNNSIQENICRVKESMQIYLTLIMANR